MSKTVDEKLDMLLEGMAFMRQELTEVKNDVTTLKSDITEIKLEQKSMQKTLVKIENSHGAKIDILFDGQEQTKQKLETIENKLDNLNDKVEKNDIEIKVIKGGKYKTK